MLACQKLGHSDLLHRSYQPDFIVHWRTYICRTGPKGLSFYDQVCVEVFGIETGRDMFVCDSRRRCCRRQAN